MSYLRLTLLLAVFAAPLPAFADDEGDSVQHEFDSQSPPDYDAIERQQRATRRAEEQQQGVPALGPFDGATGRGRR